jgi:hypothetical protein
LRPQFQAAHGTCRANLTENALLGGIKVSAKPFGALTGSLRVDGDPVRLSTNPKTNSALQLTCETSFGEKSGLAAILFT